MAVARLGVMRNGRPQRARMMRSVTVTPCTDPTPTSPSALLSLLDLRRHLLRRSSTLAVRAKALRARGDVAGAQRLALESQRPHRIAREMGQHERGASWGNSGTEATYEPALCIVHTTAAGLSLSNLLYIGAHASPPRQERRNIGWPYAPKKQFAHTSPR